MYELCTMSTLLPLLHPALSLPSAVGLTETGVHIPALQTPRSLHAVGNCQLTPQLGLPPEPGATHMRLQAELAKWFLMLEKKSTDERCGTHLNFILESRY